MIKTNNFLNNLFMLASLCFLFVVSFFLINYNNSSDNHQTIYVINIDDVYHQSQAAVKGREHLEFVIKTLKDGLQKADSIYGKDSKHPSEEVMRNGVLQIENQYKKEVAKIDKIVDGKLHEAINEWLSTNQNALIFTNHQVLGFGEKKDITKNILRIMNREEIKYPELPKIFIEKPTQ